MIKNAPLITLDFETYYDKAYSLSKMNTEAYVRDPRFEVIMCTFKVNSEPAYACVGHDDVAYGLAELHLDKRNVCCHHAHFDGFILSEHFGVMPGFWFDTLSMARAVLGPKYKASLAAIAERLGLGAKGDEVENALGLHLADFSPAQLDRYIGYGLNDTELTFRILKALMFYKGRKFPEIELRIIDMAVRMFTEPRLLIEHKIVEDYAQSIIMRNDELIAAAGVTGTQLRSDTQFAELLREQGVEPPVKASPTKKLDDGTPATTYAFAKTDEAMEELAECGHPLLEALVAARLACKSTIGQSRARRMADMALRGPAPMYLKYYAACTGRFGGGDSMNWQNMTRGSELRRAIHAPDGYILVVGDSSNIEARVLDALAGQMDAVAVYQLNDAGLGPDCYCVLASEIYGYPVVKCDAMKLERMLGKIAKLGLGYGMGAEKFVATVRLQSKGAIQIDLAEGKRVVRVYRDKHRAVTALWRRGEDALQAIARGIIGFPVDPKGVVVTCESGLLLPNGLVIPYTDLRRDSDGWTYFNGRNREHIYGGKVVENIVQALARIIVVGQTLMINTRYPVALSVHDEAVIAVLAAEREDAIAWMYKCLRLRPPWAADYPINAEVDAAVSYGDAK